MQHEDDENDTQYKVVVSHDEQYWIWPSDCPDPPGWNDTAKTGLEAQCLAYTKRGLERHAPAQLPKAPGGDREPAHEQGHDSFLLRCIADIDLGTRPGRERPELRESETSPAV
jgi:MbtH protein